MSKSKYQVPRKADFVCLTILLHDLKCFDKELSEPIDIEDADTLVHKMRNTRNVFVSLHNLKETMARTRINAGEKFVEETRALRRKLEFIVHIRNKGVGHLDRALLERAVQWTPEIFHERSRSKDDYLTYLSYKAIMESSINSYLNEEGVQKVFDTEIDFLYPPNAEQFFEFLSEIVNRSIAWLEVGREVIKSEIEFHSDVKINEMASIAAQTNFNLRDESDFKFCNDDMKKKIVSAIEVMKEIGTEDKVIDLLENMLLQ